MYRKVFRILLAGLLAATAFNVQAFVIVPVQTFTWSGFCNDADCGPGGLATAELVVLDTYHAGDPLGVGDLVTFTYNPPATSTVFSAPVLAGDPLVGFPTNFTDFTGGLPAGGVGNSDFSVTFKQHGTGDLLTFMTSADGSWSIGAVTPGDSGTAGTSQWGVPEPASVALLSFGLLGIGLGGFRRA